ncbi:MAG: carboxypeptidase M32, partial [Nitrospirota bacterium]|nr:carboxypeptidase M32 [Nitrospirota bacterium]
FLMGLQHERKIGPKMQDTLSEWVDLETGSLKTEASNWDDAAQALLREVWRDYHHATQLPSDFVRTLGLETSLAHEVWIEARKTNDFSLFVPNLKRIIALKKQETEYLGYAESPSDALMDSFEPGMTVSKISPLFESLKAKLVPLLQKIRQSEIKADEGLFRLAYDPQKQWDFGLSVLKTMGYDFERGRQDRSAHPFTTSFHPTDVRVTTRIDEHDLLSSLFSSIHEGGHGLYDQGLSKEYYGTPLGDSISLGIHESQSRLWENSVGRSRAFWTYFFPKLRETFPQNFKNIDFETFYTAINGVRPSLIRVESDEVTYNLHVMLRFEIERLIIEDNLPVEELPEVWNEKMESYLGIRPETDTDGVLQDVHWSGGAFGYFPTYTLGNLYAAQFFNQAKKDMPDLEKNIAAGNLLPLKSWLNDNIHRWGRQYSSEQMVQRVCGEAPNPDYFTDYLEEKFSKIYQCA